MKLFKWVVAGLFFGVALLALFTLRLNSAAVILEDPTSVEVYVDNQSWLSRDAELTMYWLNRDGEKPLWIAVNGDKKTIKAFSQGETLRINLSPDARLEREFMRWELKVDGVHIADGQVLLR